LKVICEIIRWICASKKILQHRFGDDTFYHPYPSRMRREKQATHLGLTCA
jgi:hypothetical protein